MPTVGQQVCDWVSGLHILGGDRHMEPFTLLGWERRFILGSFAPGVAEAALTLGRGNGKTALCGAVATAFIDPHGPLHRPRQEVICVASTHEQGRILFSDIQLFLRARGWDLEDRGIWRVEDTANRATITLRASESKVRCVGSNPGALHGLRPTLVLGDEPAQWLHTQRDRVYAALRTGLGKHPGSRLILLGTRPADDHHFFARRLEQAAYTQVHAARPDDPPFRLRTIRRANPSFDHLPSLRAEIMAEVEDARRDPDALASFRALRLNQGVDDVDVSVLVDADVWRGAVALGEPEARQRGYVLGVDLGQSAAMSAAAAFHMDGRLEALAVFPEQPGLAERGLADGVGGLYEQMARRGELLVAGNRVSDVGSLLGECLERWGRPVAIVADRFREKELRDLLDQVRFPPADLIFRGQGFKDGSEDVRAFRRAVLSDAVRPAESLLLTAAMSEARTVGDPAGNWKLAKKTQGGRRAAARDDAAAAAILAVAVGHRRWHSGQPRGRGPLRSALAG